MHFSATFKEAKANARVYREALRQIDPTGEPLGTLGIYEMVLRMPDVATMIELLNSPESLLKRCVIRINLMAFTAE
ncbi:hypothetical protein ELH71_09985 [Rhizobium ruizarguesonis]|nr:hypothetical protein ELH71_09985 [Rhizobium ruizarguesonis]